MHPVSDLYLTLDSFPWFLDVYLPLPLFLFLFSKAADEIRYDSLMDQLKVANEEIAHVARKVGLVTHRLNPSSQFIQATYYINPPCQFILFIHSITSTSYRTPQQI